MKIVATTSLPAVDRPNADRWNAARSRQKNGVFSGHYAIASSLPPERLRPNDDRWNAAHLCQLDAYLSTYDIHCFPLWNRLSNHLPKYIPLCKSYPD